MAKANEQASSSLPLRSSFWKYCVRNKRIEADERRTDELDAALMQATVDGNLTRVQRLVAQGANRHVQHSCAMLESYVTYDRDAFDTPLEAAAWLGHDDIVRYFLKQQRSSRRLLFARNSRRYLQKESSPEMALDHEAFLVACQGGTLETVKCFVEYFGPDIVTQAYPNVTPLHHACARCHLPLMQYLMQQGARLDTPTRRGGATPVHWLGMYVEMKQIHQNDNDGSPIPLPKKDILSEDCYESTLTWIIENHPQALFVPDSRGATALQRLLKRASLGFIRTAVVHLVAESLASKA